MIPVALAAGILTFGLIYRIELQIWDKRKSKLIKITQSNAWMTLVFETDKSPSVTPSVLAAIGVVTLILAIQ